IRLKQTGACVCDFDRERFLVHFEHRNILEFVPFFFADVNSSAGELIDDLIAAKKRHRILRGQIKNRAPQFLLRSRGCLHIEPEKNGCCKKRDPSQWKGNSRDTHAIRTERDQFIIRGETPENQQNRRQQPPRYSEDQRERQYISDKRDEVFY